MIVHVPGKQKMHGSSPTKGIVFVVLSHNISDTSFRYALDILELRTSFLQERNEMKLSEMNKVF